MEIALTLSTIIFIVFGILQIILFFKIWGMTNDVSNIKSKLNFTNHSLLEKAEIAGLSGNYQLAKKLLDKGYSKIMEGLKADEASEYYNSAKKDYDNLYDLFDLKY